jgi:SAM-dependent methyltransferase
VSESTGFLYADGRFRKLGEPTMVLPSAARLALKEAHRELTAHPDVRIVACLCASAADVRVSICDRHGLPLSLVLCQTCGLIRINPQPADAQLSWFYAQIYRRLYGPFGKDDEALFDSKRWKGQLVQTALRQAGLALPEGPVLDLGCGGGWGLAAFAEAGHTTLGYDFDERLIAIGTKRGLDLRFGGAEQARRAGVRSALLIFSHVLEHVPDPESELRGLKPLLRESGLLYVEVPHTQRIGGAGLGNDSLRYWQRAHLWDFQRSHLIALVARAGYDVIWTSEDDNSVFLLCRAGDVSTPSSWPHVGPQVKAQLLGFEARYHSRAHRLVMKGREAYGRGAGFVGRLLR